MTRPEDIIATLAGKFPKAFIAGQWEPHQPLKIG
jgi:hypothetical protein